LKKIIIDLGIDNQLFMDDFLAIKILLCILSKKSKININNKLKNKTCLILKKYLK